MVAADLRSQRRRIGMAGGAVAIAGALTNALGYLVPVLGARRLSAADLGALATVLAIAGIAGVPGLGLQIAVAVHRARRPGAATGRIAWVTAAVCGGAVVVLTPVAAALLDLPAAVTLLLAVYTGAVVIAGRWLGELQGDERFLRLALGMTVLAAGRYGGLIAGLVLGAGLTGTVLAGTAAALLIPPVLALLARSDPAPADGAGITARQVVTACSATLAMLVVSYADLILARHLLPPEASGAYAVGTVLTKGAIWAPQVVTVLALPRLAQGSRRTLVLAAALVAACGAALVTASALAGLATALFYPAFTGVVPEVVPEQRLQSANGVLRLGMNLARIGGFAVACAAVAAFGAGWAMALNAGLLIASASLLSGLSLPRTVTRTGSSMLADLRDGWQEFRSRQWLWVVVLQYSFVMMVLQAVFSVLGPVIANDHLGGAAGWSWVLAAESIGMVVGVVLAIRARPRRPILRVVLLTFPLAGLPLVLGLGASLPVAVLVAFAAGIAVDILVVLWDTTMQREIPAAALSRVSSYDALGTLLLGPVGLLLAGPSVVWLGARNALLISAAVTVLASLGALCSPGVRQLRWTPTPAARPQRDMAQLDIN
ncbi:MAG TPA: MFS transporter, partial [Micromonosporaceae bacterium]